MADATAHPEPGSAEPGRSVEGQSIWTELSLRVEPAAAEDVAVLLQDLTGAGVAIEPPIEALGPDEGYVLDTEAPPTLRAYLYGPVSKSRRATVRRRLRGAGFEARLAGRLSWRTLREEDWAEAWKSHYEVEHVGRIAVQPAWREYTPEPGEVVVSLDPGMAFGTGQHPTTRMALQSLQDLVSAGERLENVLDLGCGSGILAIAAVLVGAKDAVAVDIEEQAVKAARENAALNGVESRIRVFGGSLDGVSDLGPYDLVLANINAATLISLAPAIREALQPGGHVVAGGVIAERADAVAAALVAAGFVIVNVLAEGDWRSLLARHDVANKPRGS